MSRAGLRILIPDGEEILALYVARCLAQIPEVKLYILSTKRWAWSRFSRYRYHYEFIHVANDPEQYFATLVSLIEKFNIDVLLPVSDKGIEFVSTHAAVLSRRVAVAPIPDLATLKLARDKGSLYQYACERQFPFPLSLLVTFDPSFYQGLAVLKYPALLKPTFDGGGRGIKSFETPGELREFLDRQDQERFKNKYQVQSYVPGRDLGLSVLCRQGEILAFTIQQGLLSDHFGPLKAFEFIEQADVLAYGRTLMSLLKWDGVAHVDMRYDERDGQVKILEINARFWGSLLGSLVAGVNFPYLACLAALNIPFDPPPYRLGRYLHTGTAAKQLALRLLGKPHLNSFTYRETGLSFFFPDPLPETIYSTAKFVRRRRQSRLMPAKITQLAEEVLRVN